MKRSYTLEERQKFLEVLEGAKNDPATARLSRAQIINLVAGQNSRPSHTTISRWQREYITEDEYHTRLQRRGRRSKLTEEQQLLLCGYACRRRQDHKSVTLQVLSDFTSSHLGTTLSYSGISRMMKNWGFSSQRAMKRETRLTTPKVVDDAIGFLTVLRSYDYPPDRIIVMDETGLWSNVVAPKTYHFRNGFVIHFFLNSLNFQTFSSVLLFSLFLPCFTMTSFLPIIH